MRKKIVAGNWKMNLSIVEGVSLVNDVLWQLPDLTEDCHIIFCAPFTHLDRISAAMQAHANPSFHIGAQNCNDKSSGAFTGEISISMLKELHIDTVIVGHSERRQYFGESNEFLKEKVNSLVAADMHVLFCCGEPLTIREAHSQNEYVEKQLKDSLFHLDAATLEKNITIAYEPIWAIGTGVTASTEQAQEMHAFIRELLTKQYGSETAQRISILYGGSCNAQNAAELFACTDVDGGLIGGASLKPETFLPIIKAMV